MPVRVVRVKIALAFSPCSLRVAPPTGRKRGGNSGAAADRGGARRRKTLLPIARSERLLNFIHAAFFMRRRAGWPRAEHVDKQFAAHFVQLGDDTMKHARKPLAGLIALGAALAIPMAFAQDATTMQQEDPTATHDATTQEATPQEYATPEAATAQPLTWADVDADGNGTLSREEAANIPALAQVFDDADVDNDGELTQDEYRNYVAQSDANPTDGGGDD
jgi:hypothetical protein